MTLGRKGWSRKLAELECHRKDWSKVYWSECSAEGARRKKIAAGVVAAEARYVQQCPVGEPHWHLMDPQCRAKVRYDTEMGALSTLDDIRIKYRLRQGRQLEQNAYRCPHCYGWHLTKRTDWEDRPAAWAQPCNTRPLDADAPGMTDTPDSTAVRADDTLLDAPETSDEPVAQMLTAWRRDIESEPITRVLDTDTALDVVARNRAGRLRRFWHRMLWL